jgi:hypothetical protein
VASGLLEQHGYIPKNSKFKHHYNKSFLSLKNESHR